MRVKNREVVRAWGEGRVATSHTGNLTTNGKILWSYALQIGDTSGDTKVLKDYTASARWGFKSQTTSCHVGYARRFADVIV
jgi:hypothetical protein